MRQAEAVRPRSSRSTLAGLVVLLPLGSILGSSPAIGDGLEIRRDRQGVVTFSNDGVRPGLRASERPERAVLRSSRYDGLIDYHARRAGLDTALVRAVIQVESAFDPTARSHKGALGLMQLMPATAVELGVEDAFDPAENIRGGTDYLRRMLDRFGRLELALAGYNAGPSAVDRHGGIPPYAETRRYVSKVLGLYRGTPGSTAVVAASIGRPVRVVRRADDTVMLVTPD